jgi:6-phosphogluconate dehydrogenase
MKSFLADIGIYGLGPMGHSLALNFADHGYSVAAFNITADLGWKLQEAPKLAAPIAICFSEDNLVARLRHPRKIMIMVKSGAPVDEVLGRLLPQLDPGDIIIEGGNSDFRDTQRRLKLANSHGVKYVGCGVSGGEEGARFGPALMPGGNEEAWPVIRPLLLDIAARNPKGEPCCDWIGPEGAGHFIKTHHNGMEYGVMQALGEVVWFLSALGLTYDEIAAAMLGWNAELKAYLAEITAEVLHAKDADGAPLIDRVLDLAGAKGTGAGTVASALDLNQSVNILAAGLAARLMTMNRKRRELIAATYQMPAPRIEGDRGEWAARIGEALQAAFALIYSQGFNTLREASSRYGWRLNLPRIASIWTGGCIIRAEILNQIAEAYTADPRLDTLLVAPAFVQMIRRGLPPLREMVAAAVRAGVPVPALSAAVANIDTMASGGIVSARVIALQRDLFGAHGFHLTGAEPGELFHGPWSKSKPGA